MISHFVLDSHFRSEIKLTFMRNSHTGDSSICVLIVPAFLSFYEVSEYFVVFCNNLLVCWGPRLYVQRTVTG